MAWLVQSGSWEWSIRDSSEDPEDAGGFDPKDLSGAGSALAFLQDIQSDPFNEAVLRDLAEERYWDSNISNLKDVRLLELVAAELETGRLQVAGRFRPLTIAGRASAPVESESGDAPFAAPPPDRDEKTWIKFEVLDSDTGQPVPNVKLAIKLTDGSTKESTTDGSGIIEINDIPAGSCDIESMTDADALEVLSIT